MDEFEEREAVDDDAEEDEDEGADDGVLCEFGSRVAFGNARVEGEDDRNADNKDECGEDKVGGGEAVPVGVIHEVPRAGATVVVDHDHEGDGDAADDVEGEDALDGILREGRIGDGGLFFSETWLH